jgi:hypothetical protein
VQNTTCSLTQFGTCLVLNARSGTNGSLRTMPGLPSPGGSPTTPVAATAHTTPLRAAWTMLPLPLIDMSSIREGLTGRGPMSNGKSFLMFAGGFKGWAEEDVSGAS